MVTFGTVGYGDFHAYNTAEMIFTIFYITVDIAIGAYIIGTITVVVTKHDEQAGQYRERSYNLTQYSELNHIPKVIRHWP